MGCEIWPIPDRLARSSSAEKLIDRLINGERSLSLQSYSDFTPQTVYRRYTELLSIYGTAQTGEILMSDASRIRQLSRTCPGIGLWNPRRITVKEITLFSYKNIGEKSAGSNDWVELDGRDNREQVMLTMNNARKNLVIYMTEDPKWFCNSTHYFPALEELEDLLKLSRFIAKVYGQKSKDVLQRSAYSFSRLTLLMAKFME